MIDFCTPVNWDTWGGGGGGWNNFFHEPFSERPMRFVRVMRYLCVFCDLYRMFIFSPFSYFSKARGPGSPSAGVTPRTMKTVHRSSWTVAVNPQIQTGEILIPRMESVQLGRPQLYRSQGHYFYLRSPPCNDRCIPPYKSWFYIGNRCALWDSRG